MVKAHKRKNSGPMRRDSRIYLSSANVGKLARLHLFLLLYGELSARRRDHKR